MPRCLIKIKDKYFEWSTIVDAPTTYGMTEVELMAYIKDRYGSEGLKELPARLARVEKYGTSFEQPYSLKELLLCNRAGDNEKHLSADKIYKRYTD